GDPRAIGRGAAVAELRVFDDRRAAEIDALPDLGGRATDDDDDLIEGGRGRGVADDGAQQRGGAEREELLGLAETSRGAGREDEAGHERPPHRRSNVSLQARQQKYTVRSPTWERYLALATPRSFRRSRIRAARRRLATRLTYPASVDRTCVSTSSSVSACVATTTEARGVRRSCPSSAGPPVVTTTA